MLGMVWLKSINPVIDWMACSLDLTVCAKLHCTCSSSQQCCQCWFVKFEINAGWSETRLSCMVWLVVPSLIAGHQGVLAELVGGDSTKAPGTDLSRWKLICSKLSDVLRSQTLPLREL